MHTLAASFGLFTQSTGNRDKRLLHVYRSKPEGWTQFRKLTNYEMLEFMPRNDDYWMGGARECIGDCYDCGVELYGYDDGRNDDESELLCTRCGGDVLSKYDLLR